MIYEQQRTYPTHTKPPPWNYHNLWKYPKGVDLPVGSIKEAYGDNVYESFTQHLYLLWRLHPWILPNAFCDEDDDRAAPLHAEWFTRELRVLRMSLGNKQLLAQININLPKPRYEVFCWCGWRDFWTRVTTSSKLVCVEDVILE